MSNGGRNIVIGVQCFVRKNGKYLMLHRHKTKRIMPDVWMAPGGKREMNEGVFAATHREVLEETGLTIKNLRIKIVGSAYLEDLNQEVHFHWLTADYAGGRVVPNPDDGELHWLTPEEIANLPNLLAETKEVLDDLFADSQKITSYTCVYIKGNEMKEFNRETD